MLAKFFNTCQLLRFTLVSRPELGPPFGGHLNLVDGHVFLVYQRVEKVFMLQPSAVALPVTPGAAGALLHGVSRQAAQP